MRSCLEGPQSLNFRKPEGLCRDTGEGVIGSTSAEDAQQQYVPGLSTDTVISE